jgi:transcriptional repressor NrdR
MKCPFCSYTESKVIDSRPAEEGTTIRRRRECLACQKRFTTYEVIEHLPLVVVKRDGSRQSFDRNKVLNGMLRSCEKRPVSMSQLEAIADEIEQELQNSFEREISTAEVGEMVMEHLKKVDEVAYVRFASVYRQFKEYQHLYGGAGQAPGGQDGKLRRTPRTVRHNAKRCCQGGRFHLRQALDAGQQPA